MRLNSLALPLFEEDTVYTRADRAVQRHIGQAAFRKGNGKKPYQFSTWLYDWHWSCLLSRRHDPVSSLRLINEITEILCELRVPLTSSLRSDLQSNSVEPLVVAVGMTSDQGLDVISCCHLVVSPLTATRMLYSATALRKHPCYTFK